MPSEDLKPRRPRSSRFDDYRAFILQQWNEGTLVSPIAKALTTKGCEASPQNLQKWIDGQVKRNLFPPRGPSGRGRRRSNPTPSSSLGILPSETGVRPDDIPYIIPLLFNAPKNNAAFATSAMEEMGIPYDPETEKPDLIAYAKKIGLDRLRSYGDMDYVTLAAVFVDWKEHRESDKNWFPALLMAAATLRRDMIAAASSEA